MIFLWVLLGVLVLSILVLVLIGSFDLLSFGSIMVTTISFVSGYAYLVVVSKRNSVVSMEKDKFEYCWKKANEMLERMPNGDRLTWGGGKGRRSVVRTYKNDQETKTFRAMYGYLENANQHVIVIWDVKAEDIAGFIADPSSEQFINPFEDFKPFEQRSTEDFMRYRYGRDGRRISLNMRGGSPSVSDDYVRRSMNPFEDGEERKE